MNTKIGFELLKKNLVDNIKEQQAKLGYRKECLYLYYPLSSLNHFFESGCTAEEMIRLLSQAPPSVTDSLGPIEVSRQGERFCFKIPESGSQYVHEHISDNEFINALILEVSKPRCSKEQLLRLFQQHSSDIEVQDMEHGDFDYSIHFRNNEENPYYYCFHDEGFHIIYHRFTPEDYADML